MTETTEGEKRGWVPAAAHGGSVAHRAGIGDSINRRLYEAEAGQGAARRARGGADRRRSRPRNGGQSSPARSTKERFGKDITTEETREVFGRRGRAHFGAGREAA